MSFKTTLFAGVSALLTTVPAFAADIMIDDAYARAAGMKAHAGAAFFTIMNHGETDDRLIAASSDVAKKVELHTHIEDANGVMQMRHDEDGFPVAAGGSHALKRGADHVMFMGLTRPLNHGDTVSVTLTFENAGDMVVEIPVDLERKPMHGMKHGDMKHGMKHGDMKHGHAKSE
ncbi:MAG: copper chaperone PCu(A)C [Halocynthiibacter sp.]